MSKVLQAIAALMVCSSLSMLPAASANIPLTVEANVRVSRDVPMPHTESDMAVNPLNPKNIVGATTVVDYASTYNKTYASLDGGYTWKETTPVQARYANTGDPRVVFTNRGTALFISLNLMGRSTDVYRSTDGGLTWGPPAHFALFDHELVAVDRTHSRYSGRIYIAGEGDLHTPNAPPGIGGERQIWLFTSDDDGRSFVRRSIAETDLNIPKSNVYYYGGVAVEAVVVFSDGSVGLSLSRYQPAAIGAEANYFAVSHNGGLTFGPAVHVADDVYYAKPGDAAAYRARSAQKQRRGDASGEGTIIVVAIDRSNGPYRDRVYTVWPDTRGTYSRIAYRYSADRGKTWSPIAHMGTIDPTEMQFFPEVAVTNRGAVLVTWDSTAGYATRDHFNTYAALSTNGGASFSKPVRVSSVASFPRTAGNLMPIAMVYDATSLHSPGFISGYSRWSAGGDYMGLDSGSDGVFHLYWGDSRGSEYQVYSVAIHAGAAPGPASSTPQDVSADVVPAIDPIGINMATNEVDIPIRLRNLSSHTLYGPLTATFAGVENPMFAKYHMQKMVTPVSVTILNATSGGTGVGATMDYSQAMGSYNALPPGGVTEPIVWRFKLSDVDDLSPISLHLKILARY